MLKFNRIFRKVKKEKDASGKRQLITFKPLILGQVTKGQSDDIINEQIKEFESIMESFFGNQSRPERGFRDERRIRIMEFKEFYTCPNCGRAISGEKKEFFVCPNCGRALCQKKDLKSFTHNYCGNCGQKLDSAKIEALLALEEEENLSHTKKKTAI